MTGENHEKRAAEKKPAVNSAFGLRRHSRTSAPCKAEYVTSSNSNTSAHKLLPQGKGAHSTQILQQAVTQKKEFNEKGHSNNE